MWYGGVQSTPRNVHKIWLCSYCGDYVKSSHTCQVILDILGSPIDFKWGSRESQGDLRGMSSLVNIMGIDHNTVCVGVVGGYSVPTFCAFTLIKLIDNISVLWLNLCYLSLLSVFTGVYAGKWKKLYIYMNRTHAFSVEKAQTNLASDCVKINGTTISHYLFLQERSCSDLAKK